MSLTVAANPWLYGTTSATLTSALIGGTNAITNGTSLGLDRSMVSILMDCKAVLDPVGTVLTSWTLSSNPCNASGTWLGVACANTYTGTGAARVILGGVLTLSLSGRGLAGQLCPQLRELRTATTIDLSANALTGSIPSSWCALHVTSRVLARRQTRWPIPGGFLRAEILTARLLACCLAPSRRGTSVPWVSSGAPTFGFDNATSILLQQNSINGTIPASLGLITNGRASVVLRLTDNQITGTVPVSLASFGSVGLAYNPMLFGPLPWNVSVFAETMTVLGVSASRYVYATGCGIFLTWEHVPGATPCCVLPASSALTEGIARPP